jgi:diguanylate cyclase (GGDEF)-like protein
MIDLGQTVALPKNRYRAGLGAAVIAALALATIPLAARSLGTSYSVLSTVIGVSITLLALAAILLWAQSRVTLSVPLVVLAACYGATGIIMLPYLLLYHGLFPEFAAAIDADPQAASWLWFAWHALFASAPIAYLIARRAVGRADRDTYERLHVRAGIAMVVVPLVLIVPSIWFAALPPFTEHSGRTLVALACSAIVLALSLGAIVMLYVQNRFRSILDVWLAIAALCMVADVSLALVGAAPFSFGWYVSRVYIVIASSTVLVALLMQTATVYAQLAQTADRLRDESLTDQLTGLSNRRAFDERLAQALADGARMSRGAAMLMIDVDNFKLFNDSYGHLGGDECLRDLASTVRGCISRTRDMVARFGGEEFAVVMAETDMRGALIVAERIRSAVEGMGIPQPSGAQHRAVTVSIGATAVDDAAGMTSEAFIEQADRALYRAKETGRNRTVAWPLDAAVTPSAVEGQRGA